MTEEGKSATWQRWEGQGYRKKADMTAGDKGFERNKKTDEGRESMTEKNKKRPCGS